MNISLEQYDAIREMVNIGVGHAASLLNDMVSSHIVLHVPIVKVLSIEDALTELKKSYTGTELVAVGIGFTGALQGKAQLFFPANSASVLVANVTGQTLDSPDLDAIKIGTLNEIGNILINSIMGTISNLLSQQFTYSLPVYSEGKIEDLLSDQTQGVSIFVMAQTRFLIYKVDMAINILFIFQVGSLDILLNVLENL
jgi:chemotaxis protein CheC